MKNDAKATKTNRKVRPADPQPQEDEKHPSLPLHAFVELPCPLFDGELVQVDKGIAPLVSALWQLELIICNTCENNPGGMIWIEFGHPDDAKYFLTIVARAAQAKPKIEDEILLRMFDYFTHPKTKRPDWESSAHHYDGANTKAPYGTAPAEAWLDISIRFPQQDYKFVLKAIQKEVRRMKKKGKPGSRQR